MTTMKKGPTMRYGILQAGYFWDYLIIQSFAAVFLAGRGFTTSQIGTVTAGAALLAIAAQQISGTIADKSTSPLKYMVMLFMGVCMLCFAGMWILPGVFISTFVFYMVALTLQASLGPIMNALCLQFSNNGYNINFGVARSMGSLGYALAALLMGNVTEKFGPEIILPVYLAVFAILMVILFFFPVPVKDEEAEVHAGKQLIKEEPSTALQFVTKYKRFMLLMLGFVLLWFNNTMLGTYMIYFLEPMGGTSAHMGLSLSLCAFIEIPAILAGSNMMGRIGAPAMLRISAVGGIIKAILYFIAPNVFVFIGANAFNFLHSGFYQVAAVYYAYSIVGKNDIVKSQTFMGIAVGGVGSMLANYLGGLMIEALPLKLILFIGLCVSCCALGVITIATSSRFFRNEAH